MTTDNGKTKRDSSPNLLQWSDVARIEHDAAEAKLIAEKANRVADQVSAGWTEVQRTLEHHTHRMDRCIVALQENDIRQNHELERIGVAVRALDRATGRLLGDADERRRAAETRRQADRTRDASLRRIELYMKLALSLSALFGAFWTALQWAVVHAR